MDFSSMATTMGNWFTGIGDWTIVTPTTVYGFVLVVATTLCKWLVVLPVFIFIFTVIVLPLSILESVTFFIGTLVVWASVWVYHGLGFMISTIWEFCVSKSTLAFHLLGSMISTIWNLCVSKSTLASHVLASKTFTIWNYFVSKSTSGYHGLAWFCSSIWQGLGSFISWIWHGLVSFLSFIGQGIWHGLAWFCSSIWHGLGSFISWICHVIGSVFSCIWHGLGSFIAASVAYINDTYIWAVQCLASQCSNVWTLTGDWRARAYSSLVSFTFGAWSLACSTVKSFFHLGYLLLSGIAGTLLCMLRAALYPFKTVLWFCAHTIKSLVSALKDISQEFFFGKVLEFGERLSDLLLSKPMLALVVLVIFLCCVKYLFNLYRKEERDLQHHFRLGVCHNKMARELRGLDDGYNTLAGIVNGVRYYDEDPDLSYPDVCQMSMYFRDKNLGKDDDSDSYYLRSRRAPFGQLVSNPSSPGSTVSG